MGMGTCRSCGASIVWARGSWGKAMPLDQCAVSEGNIRINKDGAAVVGRKGSGPYRSHFATCPQAENWRRPPGGGEAA